MNARPILVGIVAMLLTAPLIGADCAGGGGGGGKDTGIDREGGAGGTPNDGDNGQPSTFKPRDFSGNGSTNIGTLRIPTQAILEWENQGPGYARFFSVYDAGFKLNVTSEGKSGQSVVPPGTYRNVQVDGNQWNMTIRPR